VSPRPTVESVAATHEAEVGGRWAILSLLAIAELLGMSLWFAGNAAAPQLSSRWALDPSQVGWLTAVVQLGFVAGTACSALLNLADVWSSRWLFAGSATLAALANLSLLAAGGFAPALVSRFLTGFFLAGVYPPGMKMAATWFRTGRGLAIGILVGALCTGKAIPYLVHALGLPTLDFIFYTTSAGALLSAILVGAFYRDGPFPFERRAFHWRLVAEVARHRETRLAIGGYLGHMWELYAMWTWVPAFVAAGAMASNVSAPDWLPGIAAFWTLLAGGIGCVWGGWAAARLGYARVVTVAMAASGACCFGIGFLFGSDPIWLMLALGVWGFFVVADSAQFSAMVTEAAPRHAVGTALTLQTSLGFLLTLATIQWVPVLASSLGWRWAFAVLALGPVFGIAAIARLRAR
jgi:MFS family permease